MFSPIDHFEGIIQASARGDALAYLAWRPTEPNPPGYSNLVSVLSTRGAQGWSNQVIAPPHNEGTGASVGNGEEYRFFSEDLSHAVVQPFGIDFTPLSPLATESTAYRRTDYVGDVNNHCVSECYLPLVTATNVPPGTRFGGEPDGECVLLMCGPIFVGASPDTSHIVLTSRVALTGVPVEEGLYEWLDGALRLVSVLPEGEPNEEGGVAALRPRLGSQDGSARHAISDDGTRITWEGFTKHIGYVHLYATDTGTGAATTTRLDLAQTGGTNNEFFGPHYMTSSSDGSRIYFLDAERLTEDSTAANGEPDLYEYDIEAPLGKRLTDLTVDKETNHSADVAQVIGSSEDASYIYFTAAGALAPGAVQGKCGHGNPQPGEVEPCNLYVRHDGTTKLIAGLSQWDFPDWAQLLGGLAARVSPNGHWLVFMSQRSLTGYDNRDISSGESDEEAYLYDADTDKLVCVSCNPTGGRPAGQQYSHEGETMPLVSADGDWSSKSWLAALVPPWTLFDLSQARYQSRYLSNDGRVFFDGRDALVPADSNGTWDVYEYEPAGVSVAGHDTCTGTSPTYSRSVAGCVSLISSGVDKEESSFIDASESGGDVFFLTAAKLAPQDYDSAIDVYDAHECAVQSPCLPTPMQASSPCTTTDSCRSAPTPQPSVLGAPASAMFSGSGNVAFPRRSAKRPSRRQRLGRALRACHKERKKNRRTPCVRRTKKRYGAIRRSAGAWRHR